MAFSYKYIIFWPVALLMGWGGGYLIHSAFTGPLELYADAHEYTEDVESQNHNRPSTSVSSFGNSLWRDTYMSRHTSTLEEIDYEQTVTRLYRESRSPLRATSLVSRRIQNSTFEDWEFLIGEGKVARLDVLDELGAHLARLDPERALRLCFMGPKKFDNLDHIYAFRNGIIDTIADTEPLIVLNFLKNLNRGGAQQDSSLYFSEYWAGKDPLAAADYFRDLVQLRNLKNAVPDLPAAEYGEIIMGSWISKDVDEASAYVEGLSAGSKRDVLQAAFNKLRQNP